MEGEICLPGFYTFFSGAKMLYESFLVENINVKRSAIMKVIMADFLLAVDCLRHAIRLY